MASIGPAMWCLITAVANVSALPFPPQSLPGVNIGLGLPSGYEPSGAVWHSRLNRLFVVDDNGRLTSMNADGTDTVHWNVPGDLEDIAVADPDSDFVYVGVEHPDSILEFNIVAGAVTRSFNLTTWMTGPSNSGLEALTFVPNANNAEGGLFYAGLQNDGRIYTFELPIASSASATNVTHVGTITPVAGQTDIAGMHYDAENDVLYAIFDGANQLRAMDATGTMLQEWTLAGNDQEGITFAGTDLFISEDSGRVVRYGSFPIVHPGPLGDFNRDGRVDAGDYVVWRDHVGAGPGTLANDTVGGEIGAGQYALWRRYFGGRVETKPFSKLTNVVPEPTSGWLLIAAVVVQMTGGIPRDTIGLRQRTRSFVSWIP